MQVELQIGTSSDGRTLCVKLEMSADAVANVNVEVHPECIWGILPGDQLLRDI